VIHDVALQKLNVVFCLDRGGLVGSDGATHHGAYDLAYMRCIPNITVSAPIDEEELRNLMYTAQLPDKGTFVIRYPRGNGVMTEWRTPFKEIPVGKGRMLRDGEDVAILSIGAIGNLVRNLYEKFDNEGLNVAHFDMRFAKPLDEELLHKIFKTHKNIITLEDGTIVGGFGSAVIEFMAEHNYSAKVKRLGVPDKFIEQGSQQELYKECGYDEAAIYKTVHEMLDIKKMDNKKSAVA